MSATPSPAPSLPASDVRTLAPLSDAEIDASCRAPVMFLLVSAAAWLFVGSLFAMLATLKFHAPGMLANCPLFTYGRVHPAHLNAWIYGFGMQAGFGVILWLLAHLGRTRLALAPSVIIGTVLWNLGMTLGTLGILCGDNTGFEWLEMPRYASVPIFVASVLISLGAVTTFHERRERQLITSQWLALAAIFWFPWIYTSAQLLLVAHPARGALQMAIDSWYINNLKNIWFGFIGLATIFYFIPKLANRPLYSHYIGIFVFWALMLFGSWGAIPPGSPLPSWMAAMSTMGSVLTIVPVFAVAINICHTMKGSGPQMNTCRPLKYFAFGGMAYVVAGVLGAFMSLMRVSKVINFTWFLPAQTQLLFYGFFAITMMGAIYHIVPRVLKIEFAKPSLICANFGLAVGGILFYCVPLAIGGILQGFALNDPTRPFLDVMLSTLLFLRISTLGDLLFLASNLMLLWNLLAILARVARAAGVAAWSVGTKTVEVTP